MTRGDDSDPVLISPSRHILRSLLIHYIAHGRLVVTLTLPYLTLGYGAVESAPGVSVNEPPSPKLPLLPPPSRFCVNVVVVGAGVSVSGGFSVNVGVRFLPRIPWPVLGSCVTGDDISCPLEYGVVTPLPPYPALIGIGNVLPSLDAYDKGGGGVLSTVCRPICVQPESVGRRWWWREGSRRTRSKSPCVASAFHPCSCT